MPLYYLFKQFCFGVSSQSLAVDVSHVCYSQTAAAHTIINHLCIVICAIVSILVVASSVLNVIPFFGQPAGFMEAAIPYSTIEDVHIISRWDAGHKFCIRITIPDGSLLIQVSLCCVP